MNGYKVILYIKDVQKPIIVTCTCTKEIIIGKINELSENKSFIEFDSGDVVVLPNGIHSINAIFITEEKV